jgi:EAL and modified HD-GYP domain-containing signal transduction protein
MPCSDPIFVHPLLGADDAWSGFRIEFAPGRASLEALSRLRASPQFEALDKRLLWFIPALPEASEAAQTMERSVTVFSARSSDQDSEALERLEAALRQAQHKVALVVTPENKLPATGAWDYLLIGASHARSLPPYTLLGAQQRLHPVVRRIPADPPDRQSQARYHPDEIAETARPDLRGCGHGCPGRRFP